MPYCSECGRAIDRGDRFCRDCGSRVLSEPKRYVSSCVRQFAPEFCVQLCDAGSFEALAEPVIADMAGARRIVRSGLSHYGQCSSVFPGWCGQSQKLRGPAQLHRPRARRSGRSAALPYPPARYGQCSAT
jgi:DNA-directed RNA polymerase subunit RPC12/RpoP